MIGQIGKCIECGRIGLADGTHGLCCDCNVERIEQDCRRRLVHLLHLLPREQRQKPILKVGRNCYVDGGAIIEAIRAAAEEQAMRRQCDA